MKVEFKRTFLKDVQILADRKLKDRIKAVIIEVEEAESLISYQLT